MRKEKREEKNSCILNWSSSAYSVRPIFILFARAIKKVLKLPNI